MRYRGFPKLGGYLLGFSVYIRVPIVGNYHYRGYEIYGCQP